MSDNEESTGTSAINIVQQTQPIGKMRSLLMALLLGSWEPDTRRAFQVQLVDRFGHQTARRDFRSDRRAQQFAEDLRRSMGCLNF